MSKYEVLLSRAQHLRRQGLSLEQILEDLRALGASIMDSVKIVRTVEGCTLGEVKAIIDASPTWQDSRGASDRARAAALEALELVSKPTVGESANAAGRLRGTRQPG
jgi:orotate phosphoribosyltransferase